MILVILLRQGLSLRSARFGVTMVALATSVGALAQEVSPEIRRCVFLTPLEIGASITARAPENWIYGMMTRKVYGASNTPYDGGPTGKFIEYYRQTVDGGRIFGQADRSLRPVNRAQYRTDPNQFLSRAYEVGTGQVGRLLDGDRQEDFRKSSIILGVDLFFWDTVVNSCGLGNERKFTTLRGPSDKMRRRGDVEFMIQRLTSRAAEEQKILILGEIPRLDPSKFVLEGKKMFGVIGPFSIKQHPACLEAINAELRKDCKVDRGCYLIDLKPELHRLDRGGKLELDGKELGREEILPDGVHLSKYGSELAFRKLRDIFGAQPPKVCPKVSDDLVAAKQFLQEPIPASVVE